MSIPEREFPEWEREAEHPPVAGRWCIQNAFFRAILPGFDRRSAKSRA